MELALVELAQMTDATLPSLWYELARTGVIGVLFVLVCYALVRRDRDLTIERAARLDDAKGLRSMIEAATASKVEQNKLQEEHNRLTEVLTAKLNELIARQK